MRSYLEIIEEVDRNQQKIAEHGLFDEKLLKKINYKLRLDWNYYSNRMEGGTLTKAETRSVMVGNIEVKGKPFKDVAEMSGHNKMVIDVLKMGKGELSFSEKRIKEIHKIIMYEDDPEKQKLVGEWKNDTNEIINYKGEKITFCHPDIVQQEVHKTLNAINSSLERVNRGTNNVHPVILAAQFHIDFITIHPFYDGNGRTTRILTNIILIACGYPPIIIKESHKAQYYQLLADIQVYGGNPSLFFKFIGERLIDTQQLILDAIAGNNIDDEDEIDKIILQAKLELADKKKVIEPLTKKAMILLLNNCIKESFEYINSKTKEFENEFVRTNKHIDFTLNHNGRSVGDENELNSVFQNMIQFVNDETRAMYQAQTGYSISFVGFRKSFNNKNAHFSINYDLSETIGKVVFQSRNVSEFKFSYNEKTGGILFNELKKYLDEALILFIQDIVELSK